MIMVPFSFHIIWISIWHVNLTCYWIQHTLNSCLLAETKFQAYMPLLERILRVEIFEAIG